MRNFPIDPHYKKKQVCNVMSIEMTLQKWAIFIIGVHGEIICPLSDQADFFSIFIKTVYTRIMKVSATNKV